MLSLYLLPSLSLMRTFSVKSMAVTLSSTQPRMLEARERAGPVVSAARRRRCKRVQVRMIRYRISFCLLPFTDYQCILQNRHRR